MDAYVNTVTLLGELETDACVTETLAGGKIAEFDLLTMEMWLDRKSGERRQRSEISRVVVLGNPTLVQIAEKHCKSGRRIYLVGHLQTSFWMEGDRQCSITQVVVGPHNSQLKLLDRAGAQPAAV